MADAELEFFFDPLCPFCWVASRWIHNVARQRPLAVTWRPLSLRILNEPIGYEGRPPDYPAAHQRGLEMLRVVDAAREAHGPSVIGELYTVMGEAVWNAPAPEEATFEAMQADNARRRDLAPILARAGLPEDLAAAAEDEGRDTTLSAEVTEAVERAGGGVGTPILSFAPPDGPAFFGPVLDDAPDGEEALRLWDAVTTLADHPGFAELKRSLRSFPHTPVSARIAGRLGEIG